MPDFHQGDSLPLSFLDNVEPPLNKQENLSLVDKAKNAAIVPATLGPWLAKHRESVSRPLIDGFVNTVRMTPGTNKIGAVGFCWGGRYAILQAHGQGKSGGGSDIGGVDAAYAVRRFFLCRILFHIELPATIRVMGAGSLVLLRAILRQRISWRSFCFPENRMLTPICASVIQVWLLCRRTLTLLRSH